MDHHIVIKLPMVFPPSFSPKVDEVCFGLILGIECSRYETEEFKMKVNIAINLGKAKILPAGGSSAAPTSARMGTGS